MPAHRKFERWRKELDAAMEEHGESMEDIIETTIGDQAELEIFLNTFIDPDLDVSFHIWTMDRVYIAVQHDRVTWIESALRDNIGEGSIDGS